MWFSESAATRQFEKRNTPVHILIEEHLCNLLCGLSKEIKRDLDVYSSLEAQHARLANRVAELHGQPVLDDGQYARIQRANWTRRLLLTGVLLAALMLPILWLPGLLGAGSLVQWIPVATVFILNISLIGIGILLMSRTLHHPEKEHFYNEQEKIKHANFRRRKIAMLVGVELGLVALVSLSRTLDLGRANPLEVTIMAGFLALLVPIVGGYLAVQCHQTKEAFARTTVLRHLETRMAQIELALHKNASKERHAFQHGCIKSWLSLQKALTSQKNKADQSAFRLPITFELFHSKAVSRYSCQHVEKREKSNKYNVLSSSSIGYDFPQRITAHSGDGANTSVPIPAA